MGLVDALRTKDKTTENGMPTNSTTLNMCVDLFSRIGSMRTQSETEVVNLFVKAFEEDALTAMKVLFWVRDVRGGAGERKVFRTIIKYLADNRTEAMAKNTNLIPVYGRWDDVFLLFGTALEEVALKMISSALKSGDGLAAKWSPRPNGSNIKKKVIAKKIAKYMGLTPKTYRKMLAEATNVIETNMCNRDFSMIDYSKVPSKAMADYARAFTKNDGDRYIEYLESVDKGEVKINTGAVYPYNVINMLSNGNPNGANTMWNNLPNYMENNNEMLLPVVDVSGSMNCSASDSGSITCMDVAISLGLYISERNEGSFKDSFITFSEQPELEYLKGNLIERYAQLHSAKWGMSTNLEAVFQLILDKAKENNIAKSEMPTMVLILSDMQFNEATDCFRSRHHRGTRGPWSPTAQEMISSMYEEAGYEIPKLVYWNLNARNSDSPVKFSEDKTALVSGFNTSLLTNILDGSDITPYSMMMNVINSSRYEAVTI